MATCLEPRQLYFISAVISFIGVVIQSVGTCTPRWSVFKDHITGFAGLFYFCNGKICSAYFGVVDTDMRLIACEVFSVGGMCAGLAATIFSLLFFLMKLRDSIMNRTPVFNITGGVLTLISVTIWATSLHDSTTDRFGYSFYLSIAGACVMALSSFLALFREKLSSRDGSTIGHQELRNI